MSWNETDQGGPGRDRRVLVSGIVAIAAILALGAGLLYLSSGSGKASTTSSTRAATITTGNTPSVSSTGPSLPTSTSTIPSSTLPGGAPNYEVAPEGDVSTAGQLGYRYPESASGLSDATYQKAVETAKEFSLADATGQGVAQFSDYYSTVPNIPWAKTYNLVFATAQAVPNSSYVKGLVFWNGVAIKNNQTLKQVTQTVYLDGTSFAPVSPLDIENAGLDKPGYDIQIVP